MVFLKKKPVVYTPLPSLTTILQPLSATVGDPSDAPINPADEPPIPADADDDATQLEILRSVFRGEFEGAQGNVGPGKGKKAGTRLLSSHSEPNGVAGPSGTSGPSGTNGVDMSHIVGYGSAKQFGGSPGPALDNEGTLAALVAVGAVSAEHVGSTAPDAAAGSVSNPAPVEVASPAPVHWRIWDRECYYLPETGEVFTDYESYLNRVMFYQQSIYTCETTGKSNLDYYKANESEVREAKNLHTRFPRQLKYPVLKAVQFQIEGKMDKLVDAVYDRFQSRFYIGERVFVDYEGERYLAKVIDITPPSSSTSSAPHIHASDLNIEDEELIRLDNPLEYSYTVKLVEKGSEADLPGEYAGVNEQSADGYQLQVSPEKIVRLHFSKMMLKRFLRDCTTRDAAVYSPWMLKPAVAERYGLPTEMSDEVRERITAYREQKMDQRKREREERLGITHGASEPETAEEEKPKTKKAKHAKEEPVVEEEEVPKAKKPVLKYPIDDLLIKFNPDFDGAQHGRLPVRPPLNRSLPFGDLFEKFLMTWSFLNVMGKPLGLSPFTLDDFEQALYHNDPWTSPTPLLVEVHATLLNALIADLAAGHEAVKPISLTGMNGHAHDENDYWEGVRGATTETLRPIVEPLGKSWYIKYLSPRDSRKGWEGALVGCLWERATLDTLPNFLDNILHLTFEDKPAPTRPTWSTGPAQTSGNGLIIAKPEKRYATLHHLHKLEILAFLTDLVAQTAAIRDFMEDETSALTESRKEQVEVKREWKRVHTELLGLEPKEEQAEGDAMDIDVPNGDRAASIELSIKGLANGNKSATDRDELDSSPAIDDEDDNLSDIGDLDGPNITAASRRRAMKERAAERDAQEATRLAKVAEDKAKRTDAKLAAAEKKRLQDEYKLLTLKLRHIDYDLRAHMFALRSRPLGQDRFGNKVWWLDGFGSAPLVNEKGQAVVGTGKLFVQGGDDQELELMRLAVEHPSPEEKQGLEGVHRPNASEVAERRKEEEGDRILPGEWACIDTVEQVHAFMKWLNPRGTRDSALYKRLNSWLPEIEAGIKKRRTAAGLEELPEGEEPVKKSSRPVRKVVAAGGLDRDRDDDGAGHLGYKNRRAKDK